MLKTQKSRSASRLVALTTAAAITTMALLPAAPAQAADSKSYKYGAIGLGVLGAVLLSKGKTLEGAAALGGGYYAYKKSGSDRDEELRDQRRADRRNDRWDRNDRDWNNGRNDYNNDYNYDDNSNRYRRSNNGSGKGKNRKDYKWDR